MKSSVKPAIMLAFVITEAMSTMSTRLPFG